MGQLRNGCVIRVYWTESQTHREELFASVLVVTYKHIRTVGRRPVVIRTHELVRQIGGDPIVNQITRLILWSDRRSSTARVNAYISAVSVLGCTIGHFFELNHSLSTRVRWVRVNGFVRICRSSPSDVIVERCAIQVISTTRSPHTSSFVISPYFSVLLSGRFVLKNDHDIAITR